MKPLQLIENLRLICPQDGGLNYSIQRRNFDKKGNPKIDKDGNEVWTSFLWYPRLGLALQKYADLVIEESDSDLPLAIWEAYWKLEELLKEADRKWSPRS